MSNEMIEQLIENLSCDFVLADPKEPESLTCLLPILKKIHGKCIKLEFNDQAKDIVNARKIINTILDSPNDTDKKLTALGELISKLSSSLILLKQTDQPRDSRNTQSLSPALDNPGNFVELEENLDKFTKLLARFCPGEIPDLGAMLNSFDHLIEASKAKDLNIFHEICIACKNYVENMTLENINNTKPIEEGLLLLKSILSHIKKGKVFGFDYSDVLQLLDIKFKEELNPVRTPSKEAEPEIKIQISPEIISPEIISPEIISPEIILPEKISNDDMEILMDFVSEARENLDTIEVNLIDLEQDPSNKDIINEIFRPFHTIKGVSGFLSLTKINKLAHTTENLLDSARSGNFLINDIATDAILEAVDTLKKLIDKVKQGIVIGFIQPDDDIDVEYLRNKLQTLQAALARGDKEPLGEILVRKGSVNQESLDQCLETQKEYPEKKIGEILVEEKIIKPKQVASALMDQDIVKKQVATQVKVSTEKLDDLVDYAGELVIAQSMLKQKASNDPSLSQSVAQLGQIVTNMQNIAMSMRMIPIKATFMKMIRLVRDLSRKQGKDIALNMVGEETEIDRNVVDALYEPMVHMIRNSCDHGIELSSDRLEQGKSSQGSITLRAYHKGGNIIIEIEDDGKGLDKDRILEKAKETGIITGSEQMTDVQIYNLILRPGFSTAQEITDVSGRGVGMDVVKTGIEKFRGNLNINSSKGAGSKFIISLPLTLAIIDGMLVRVDDERYVIPTMAIQKAFKPARKDYFTVEGKGELVRDRGDLIPVIRLNEINNSSSSNSSNNNNRRKPVWDSLVIVVESKDEKRALLIDELLGKDEYVIKNLGTNLENIKGIAGGAILADGRVGLILDVHGIFSLVGKR